MNRSISSAKALALVPILLLGFAGAASARPALSPDLQKQMIAMHYVGCLSKAAVKYDDGVSDPSVIAARITPVCADEFMREQTAFSDGLSPRERVLYVDAVTRDQAGLATQVVIDTRLWKKPHRRQRVAQAN